MPEKSSPVVPAITASDLCGVWFKGTVNVDTGAALSKENTFELMPGANVVCTLPARSVARTKAR